MPNISSLNVNGRKVPVNVDPQASLLTVLRDYLNFTGTKYGCGEAQCGACTVSGGEFRVRRDCESRAPAQSG